MRVSVFIAASLDGYIARPDGDIDWLHEVEQSEDAGDAGYNAFFSSIDVLVMGRGTFEKVLEFAAWPYTDKPVVVLSHSLTKVPDDLRDRVRIKAGSPQAIVDALTAEGFKHMYLDGGKVFQSFLAAGLVDDMCLTHVPRLLGKGIPLFGSLEEDIMLRHIETQAWGNGLVQSTYQVLKK